VGIEILDLGAELSALVREFDLDPELLGIVEAIR